MNIGTRWRREERNVCRILSASDLYATAIINKYKYELLCYSLNYPDIDYILYIAPPQ